MDPTILAALVGAGGAVVGAALGGPTAGVLVSRRLRRGQIRLTAAQAREIEAHVYDQLIDRLQDQLTAAADRERRLEDRVGELEAQLRQLRDERAHDAARERELLDELATVRAERDEARAVLREREAELAAARGQADTLSGLLAAAQSGPQVVVTQPPAGG